MEKRNLIRVFFFPLLIALVFPLLVVYVMGPSVKAIVVEDSKKEALRLAGHLRNILALESAESGGVSEGFRSEAGSLARQFNLYKLSILSKNGEVIFSTDKDDIGFINRRENFKQIISRAEGYAVYKEKGTKSEEGYVLNSDVIETYMPIMKDGAFAGAIDVYYDITESREGFRQVEKAFSLMFFVIAFVGLAAIMALAVRAERERRMKTESERKYKDLVELSPDIIYRSNKDGLQTYMNEAAFAMLEYSPEEIIGKPFIDLIHPEDREKTFRMRKDMLDKGIDIFNFENRYVTKTGKALNVFHNVRVLRDEQGDPAGTQGVARDITELRKSTEELRLFSAAIEEAIDGVQIVDLNGRIIYSNKAVEEIYGFTSEELLGKHVNDMNIDGTFADRVILPSIMTAGRWNGEIQVRHKNGKTFTVWLTASIVRNSSGVPIAMIGIIRDITDKKSMEIRLYEYQQRLEEVLENRTMELRTVSEQLHQSRKMEAIGQLAGGIAHDFNNRLAAIMNYCSILDKKLGNDDPLSTYVCNMMASLDKAAGLTKSLLAFSSKQLMNIKPAGLNEIIKGVGVLLGRTLGEDILLKTMLSEKDIVVLADANQIENVLINLATNARDAMTEGGVLTISTGMAEPREATGDKGFSGTKAFAVVSVTDTGTGIDDEIRERIFEPFFTTKEYGKGTGLGLSTAYGIIKQHGGGIDLVSRPGRGTTFKIYLPVAASSAAETPAEQSVPVGGTETILLVEDDPDVRNSLKELLEGFGYVVLDACDGEEAVEVFEKRKKDIQLLILDIIMPGMNGKAVYEMARASKPGVKAIFTSGYASDILGSKGITDGDISFIAKPVSRDALLGKIREVLVF